MEVLLESAVSTQRGTFIKEIVAEQHRGEQTIYRLPPTRSQGDQKLDRYIKVVMALDWPIAESDRRRLEEAAVAGSIYRVKVALEQTIGDEIDLYDIRKGCISIRFRLRGSASERSVQRAIHRLWLTRDLYSVISVMGHWNGRSIPTIFP